MGGVNFIGGLFKSVQLGNHYHVIARTLRATEGDVAISR